MSDNEVYFHPRFPLAKGCVDAANAMNESVERMAEAHWNLTATIPWKECPEAWKGPERQRMAVAIQAERESYKEGME